jgi:hypothetical protein
MASPQLSATPKKNRNKSKDAREEPRTYYLIILTITEMPEAVDQKVEEIITKKYVQPTHYPYLIIQSI